MTSFVGPSLVHKLCLRALLSLLLHNITLWSVLYASRVSFAIILSEGNLRYHLHGLFVFSICILYQVRTNATKQAFLMCIFLCCCSSYVCILFSFFHDIKYSTSFILIPVTPGLLRIRIAKISAHSKKKNVRRKRITLSTTPFYWEPGRDLSIDNNPRFSIFVKYVDPLFLYLAQTLKKLSVFLMKDHDTESKATSKSISSNNPLKFRFSV